MQFVFFQLFIAWPLTRTQLVILIDEVVNDATEEKEEDDEETGAKAAPHAAIQELVCFRRRHGAFVGRSVACLLATVVRRT